MGGGPTGEEALGDEFVGPVPVVGVPAQRHLRIAVCVRARASERACRACVRVYMCAGVQACGCAGVQVCACGCA